MSWVGDQTPPPMTPEDAWAAVRNYNVRPSGPYVDGLLTDNTAPGTGGIFVGRGATPEIIGSQPLFQQGVGVIHESVGDMIRSMGNIIMAGEADMSVVPEALREQVAHYINYTQGDYGDQPRFEDEPPTEDYTDFVPEDEPILEPTYSDEPAVENKGALDWWLKNGDRTNAGQRFAHLSDEQKDYLVANDPSLAPEFGRGEMSADQSGQNSVDAIDSQIEDPNIVDQDLTEGDLSGLDEESLLNSFQGEARAVFETLKKSASTPIEEILMRQLEAEMLRGGGIGIRVNGNGSIDIIGNLGLPGPLGVFEIQLKDENGNITIGTSIRDAIEDAWKKVKSLPGELIDQAEGILEKIGGTVSGNGNILDAAGNIIGTIFGGPAEDFLSDNAWLTGAVLGEIVDILNRPPKTSKVPLDAVDDTVTSTSQEPDVGEPTTGSEGNGGTVADDPKKTIPPLGGEAPDEEDEEIVRKDVTESDIVIRTQDPGEKPVEEPLWDTSGEIFFEDNNGGGDGDNNDGGGGNGDGGGGPFSDGNGDGGGGDGIFSGGGDGGINDDGGGGGGDSTESEDPPFSDGGSGGGGGGGGGGGLFASNPYMGGLGYDLQAPRSVVYDPTDPMIQLDRIIQKSLFQGMI